MPRRRPLENSTLPDLAQANDEGPNATNPADFAVSSQAVVVDPSGSM